MDKRSNLEDRYKRLKDKIEYLESEGRDIPPSWIEELKILEEERKSLKSSL